MDPVTIKFKTVRKKLSHIAIKLLPTSLDAYLYYDFERDRLRDLYLPNIIDTDPEDQVVYEQDGIVAILNNQLFFDPEKDEHIVVLNCIHFIGGDGLEIDDIPEMLSEVRKETSNNLIMPIEEIKKRSYLEEVLNYYIAIEKQIVEDNDGNLSSNEIDTKDVPLDNYLNATRYKSFFAMLKESLRDEILFFTNLLNDFPKHYKPEIPNTSKSEVDGIIKLDTPINPKNDVQVKSFKWKRMHQFEKDMVILHDLLIRYGIISNDTNIKDLSLAFSGRYLDRLLRIRWLIIGKNKSTSKSSLFHFISKLEDNVLIESYEWNATNYSSLYRKISTIFTDKEGNSFSIDGLKSSRSQGITANCAKEDEINIIVKTIADLKPDMDH